MGERKLGTHASSGPSDYQMPVERAEGSWNFSLISSQENPFGGTQPFLQRKAKTRKLGSNFLGQRAAGRNKGSRECTSPEEHAHRHRGRLCHISGTRRKKKHQQPPQRLLQMWLLPSCLPAGSISIPHRPLSQGSPSPPCLPCSPHGKLTAPLESLSPGTQG